MRSVCVCVFSLAVVVVGLTGCPDPVPPRVEEALPPEPGQTLVVDMGDGARSNLEAGMKQGLVVVRYNATSFDFLFNCQVDGTYGFIGTTTRSRVVKLTREQDIAANLPLSAINPTLRGQVGGELHKGGAIDIAYMTVGQRTTTRTSVSRGMLHGECDGATHVVRAATVGAFAMVKGAHDERKSAVEIFGIKAGANGAATMSDEKRDGDAKACDAATPDADKPPAQCGAPIYLRLMMIDSRERIDSRVDDQPCPTGYGRSDDGTCTKAGGPHECKMSEPNDCDAQCSVGNAASCGIFGFLKQYGGKGVAVDEAAARALYKKACDGGAQFGCAGLGVFFAKEGNFNEAVPLFKTGCDAGNARGCANLGVAYGTGQGVPRDELRAVELFKRACGGGDANACANLGRAYEKGAGGTPDMAAALRAYKQACDGGEEDVCARVKQ
jgi:hypothetical protein